MPSPSSSPFATIFVVAIALAAIVLFVATLVAVAIARLIFLHRCHRRLSECRCHITSPPSRTYRSLRRCRCRASHCLRRHRASDPPPITAIESAERPCCATIAPPFHHLGVERKSIFAFQSFQQEPIRPRQEPMKERQDEECVPVFWVRRCNNK
jgi:hypothetical protein